MVVRVFLPLVAAVLVVGCGALTVSPSASAPATSGWQLLTGFPANGAAQVNGIVATAGGFVAVGTQADENAACLDDINHGRIWTSADGASWTARPDDAFGQTDLTNLVSFGANLYAFGTSGIFADEPCSTGANPPGVNSWRSADGGASWEHLAQAPDIAHATIGEVVVAGDHMVMVGSQVDTDGNDEAASWSSTDALTWTPAELPPATTFVGSAAARDNVIVGFGFDQEYPLPWITRDGGGHWYEESIDLTGVETDDGVLSPGIEDVLATNAGYVAVGDVCCTGAEQILPISASTPDGTQWQGAPMATDQAQAMRRIGQLPAGLLAVGVRIYLDEAPATGELGGLSWTSTDGRSWQAGPPFAELGDGNVTAFAIGDSGVVVAGTTFIDNPTTAGDTGLRVWYAPLSAFAGGTSN